MDDYNIPTWFFSGRCSNHIFSRKSNRLWDEDILDYIIKNKPGGNIDDGLRYIVSDGQYSFLDDSGTSEDNTSGLPQLTMISQ